MTPLALDLSIRARIFELKRDALAFKGAPVPSVPKSAQSAESERDPARPRPVMILPSDPRLLRQLMRGLIYRAH